MDNQMIVVLILTILRSKHAHQSGPIKFWQGLFFEINLWGFFLTPGGLFLAKLSSWVPLGLNFPKHSSNKAHSFGKYFGTSSYGPLCTLGKLSHCFGCWTQVEDQLALPGRNLYEWDEVKVDGVSVFLDCGSWDRARSGWVEAVERKGIPNLSATLTKNLNLASLASSWRGWKILAVCPSQWDIINLDWELRRGSPDFLAIFAWGGTFVKLSWSGGTLWGGRKQWFNSHRISWLLTSWTRFSWINVSLFGVYC